MALETLLLAAAIAATPVTEPVTLQGIGPLRVGLSLDALRTRFGAIAEHEPDPEANCGYWIAPAFAGVAMMVVDDRLVRIDIDDPRYRTRSGARVGMSEREVRALYGAQMQVEPHPYTAPDGHYLVYLARSEPFGMIFETDNGRAISFRVGYRDNVQWIEGCS